MCKVNHKSLIYQCFHETLSHLALFYFSIWHYFTYPSGGSLFSTRTFTRYIRHERPPVNHRFRYTPPLHLCFPLQLSAAFDCITASSRSVCYLISPSVLHWAKPLSRVVFHALLCNVIPHRNDGFNHKVFT